MPTAPRLLLADADAFFVAVARAVDPEGAGRTPLLIVGGRPGSRGVVCSASYETRVFGVRSAMPISQALRLCPQAMCVPVPRDACAEYSRVIRRVLERFTPVVEAASIDEWYLDLSGTEALYHHEPLAETARRIRQAVLDDARMTISVGGGSSRLMAKLAAERAKPSRSPGAHGVWVVDTGAELAFMRDVALAEIPGIGPKLQAKLLAVGLSTASDVLPLEMATLERWMGARTAAWLHDRVRGRSGIAVEPRAPARQISREETFDRDIADTTRLTSELRHLAAKVATDMRGEGLAARTVSVKLRESDFSTRSASRTLREPIESDRAMADVAQALLIRLRGARPLPARLLGVAASNFAAARDAEQLSIFVAGPRSRPRAGRAGRATVSGADAEVAESVRDRELSRAVDLVREKFGSEAIHSGAPRRRPVGEKGARTPRD